METISFTREEEMDYYADVQIGSIERMRVLTQEFAERLPIERRADFLDMTRRAMDTLEEARLNSYVLAATIQIVSTYQTRQLLERQPIIFAVPGCTEVAETAAACSICTDDYAIGAVLRKLPCNHRFHLQCLVGLVDSLVVGQQLTCPNCRYNCVTNSRPP